jgi:hypothetical protein
VAEQEHLAVVVTDDPGDADHELGVREPQDAPLQGAAHEVPRAGDEAVHGKCLSVE